MIGIAAKVRPWRARGLTSIKCGARKPRMLEF
jgi:hypothetical protein